jgi:molybdate transport system permease protein
MLSADEWQAIRLSLTVSLTAVGMMLPLAIGLAWVLAKRDFIGKPLVEVLINLPLVLPPVVTGFFLLAVFGRNGLLGTWLESSLGIRFVFDWKGAVIASAIVGFPLLVRPIRIAFESIDTRLMQAARTLGASSWDAFWSVALPLARNGIVAGSVLAFARSMGEFGATIMIAGNIPGETQTISLLVYSMIESPDGMRRVLPLVVVSIVIACLALFVSDRLERKHRKWTQHGTHTP